MSFTPVFQTLRRPALSRAMADTGFHCYEACVASIYGDDLEFTASDLPANWVGKPSSAYWADLEAFMAARGRKLWWQPADDWPQRGGWFPEGFAILTGRSSDPTVCHSVVYRDGDLFHDPMPGGRGVAWPLSFHLWIPVDEHVAPVCNWFNEWQADGVVVVGG